MAKLKCNAYLIFVPVRIVHIGIPVHLCVVHDYLHESLLTFR